MQDPDQGPAQVQPLGDASPDPLFQDTLSPVRAERQHIVLQDDKNVLSQRAGRHTDPVIPMRSTSQRAERQQHVQPYGRPHVVSQYLIHSHSTHEDGDPALEDDEMLELQINLGEVKEKNLMRKIEHKRRRANQSASSDGGFNLARELEAEIDKEMAKRLEEEKKRNKVLENELAMVHVNLTHDMKAEHESIVNRVRAEMQAQFDAHSARVERQYEEMLSTELAKQKQEFEARALLSSQNAGTLVATHEHNIQDRYLTEMQQHCLSVGILHASYRADSPRWPTDAK